MLKVMGTPRLHFTLSFVLVAVIGFLSNTSCVTEHRMLRGEVEAMRVRPGPGLELLARATVRRMAEVLEGRAQATADRAWRERTPDKEKDLDLEALQALHEGRSGGWWVTRHGEITAAGEGALATLARSDQHRLNPEKYGAASITAQREALAPLADRVGQWKQTTWPAPAHARVRAWLIARAHAPHDIEDWLDEAMAAGVLGASGNQWSVTRSLELAELAERSWVLELTISDALLRYAGDLRVEHVVDKTGPKRVDGSGEDGWNGHESAVTKVRALTEDLANVERGLERLAPPYPQYQRLVEAHARYQAFCAAGGWSVLRRSTPIKPRGKGTAVQWLRERLKAEGHLSADYEPSAGHDGVLEDAVKAYQSTHQYKPDGIVNRRVLRSLNVSCERRLAEISVTLEKWRESRILNPHGHFIHVNVPSFLGEVWEHGEVQHAFKVVVGNRKVTVESGKREYLWATPELSSKVRNLVLNPYWNVPSSILIDDEILESHDADEAWATDNHYEIVEDEKGRRSARQLPGPWNALGLVKFVFPNEHSVYLHDTPSKSKFRLPYRAYSHGCMRVDKAMELAQYLLERQGQWKRRYVKNPGNDRWLSLRESVPIYVTYFVVTVDAEGAVHFGSDLYRRDESRITALFEQITAEALPSP